MRNQVQFKLFGQASCLAARMLAGFEKQAITGPATVLIPGIKKQSLFGGSSFGVIGKKRIEEDVTFHGVPTKSEEYFQDEVEKIHSNQPLPFGVAAYLADKQKLSLAGSESFLTNIFGAFTNEEKSIERPEFKNLQEKFGRSFFWEEEGKELYEIGENYKLTLANFGPEVVSFSSNRSPEELEMQNKFLEEFFNKWIEKEARERKFDPWFFTEGLKHFTEPNRVVFWEFHKKAIEINPKYREKYEEYRDDIAKELEGKKLAEQTNSKDQKPSTIVANPESENLFYSERGEEDYWNDNSLEH